MRNLDKEEIKGIKDIYNKSDKKRLLIEIECDGSAAVVLNQLLKSTDLQKSYNPNQYVFINSDGGTGSYYGGASNGSGLLIGSGFKYNEETGFWHVYNNQTGEFGPVLCAKITKPCAYYEESLNLIESHGNKNLTVSVPSVLSTNFGNVTVNVSASCVFNRWLISLTSISDIT